MQEKTLYLGLDPSSYETKYQIEHKPIIKIVPQELSFDITHKFSDFSNYSHVIFTSKNAVKITKDLLIELKIPESELMSKKVICIGDATASSLKEHFGMTCSVLPDQETQEGIIDLLELEDFSSPSSYVFVPCSLRARTTLKRALSQRGVRHQVCHIYSPKLCPDFVMPDLSSFKEIVFTSPSTVEAFFSLLDRKEPIPSSVSLESIGPVTKKALESQVTAFQN